ncbi:hypothetical protein C2869_16570 [Saccharobesus litoralis]|uniref:GGDEF domain-containing protein n=1 Tax=Saccharobesus litoralis TaxID=2172099 RepID=A0A2S0VUQ5_9ALTE|nr:sensor domain-containing diguanylate cyclase [Saccharobesus litoralis]AWB67938.1 hypothetical protein C2869_16570 [Saccharobesus litoralis]
MTLTTPLTASDLNKLPVVIYKAKLDSARNFIVINGAVKRLFGSTVEQAVDNPLGYIAEQDLEKVKAFFHQLNQVGGDGKSEYEISYRAKVDGQTYWLTERGHKVNCTESDSYYLHGIIFDNTETIETERQIESLLSHRTQELEQAKQELEATLAEQQRSEEYRVKVLEKTQFQQSITFELSTSDSVMDGDVKQAADIVCNKLKSGLFTDNVIYHCLLKQFRYKLDATTEPTLVKPQNEVVEFPAEFIYDLQNSLCLDYEDIAAQRLDTEVKDLFITQYQAKAALIFPVKYDNELVGFFSVLAKNCRKWSIDEIIFVSGLADQMRTTLNNRDKKIAGQKLHQLAYYDTLTGLENRTAFFENAKQAIALAKRNQQRHAFIYIDLDDFKFVNDTYGHDAGDKVLVHTANVIRNVVRNTDHCARIGGDEFNILLMDVHKASNAESIVKVILKKLAEPLDLGVTNYAILVSIGICMVDENQTDLEQVIKLADTAMYQAKRNGKNQYCFS